MEKRRTCPSALSYPGIYLEVQDDTKINLSQSSRCCHQTVSAERKSIILTLGTTCSGRMRGAVPPLLTSILDIKFKTGTNLPLFIVKEMLSVNKLIVLICVLKRVYALFVTQFSHCSRRQHTHMQAPANCSELLESLQISIKPFISLEQKSAR